MKNILMAVLLSGVLCGIDACSKKSDTPQSENQGVMLAYPTGYTFNSLFSGLNYFDFATLHLSLTDKADTILYSINVPNAVNNGVQVTVGVDPGLVAAYNSLPQQVDTAGQSYVLMPPGDYALVDSSGAIVASGGQFQAVLRIVFYPSLFDPAQSYMLPISIRSTSPNIPIDQNMKTIYFHQLKTN
jgi:Domain of unknown function (DUF1735)